ncbi:hypothetical protein WJX74_004533 [Apatococcus lobatus]|uniref:WIBG Mago-binding domain-containing protein n=2 Tax=Apatococcus TaxID=904362 RepID=A0AAW1T8D6_9CHLO
MSASANSETEDGERVIRGSRRPDGTYRKDIRVKAGYVPLEEQATFSSRSSQFRNGPGRVPGLIIDEVPEQPAVRPKGKSAKRNEAKRKKKEEEQLHPADGMLASQTAELRLEGQNGSSPQPPSAASSSPPGRIPPSGSTAHEMASNQQGMSSATSVKAASNSAAGGLTGDQNDLEKRLRALRKKLRQVDSLQDKQAAGQLLMPDESEKLKHAQQWRAEASNLEYALAQ